MKRTLISLLTAGVLAVGVTVPVAASEQTSPWIGLAVCRNAADNTLMANISWVRQTPGDGDLEVTITFKGPTLRTSSQIHAFVGPIPAESVNNEVFLPVFVDSDGTVSDWNSWASVSISATGAFVDDSRNVRQHDGWSDCPLS